MIWAPWSAVAVGSPATLIPLASTAINNDVDLSASNTTSKGSKVACPLLSTLALATKTPSAVTNLTDSISSFKAVALEVAVKTKVSTFTSSLAVTNFNSPR